MTILFIGCGGYTDVSLKNYEPVFTWDHSVYKGKSIYLINFENRAEDTTIWYYFSTDSKFRYGIEAFVHNYFWYGFYDALVQVEMIVTNVDNPAPNAPAMWLTLLSITDEYFQVKITLQRKGDTGLVKRYKVKESPLLGYKRTPAALEKRAYEMTNMLFETILNDPDFEKVFL